MKNTFKKIITIKIILIIILLNFYLGFAVDVDAAINKQINYQGRLLDSAGDAVADGSYGIDFGLYTVATLGSAVWTESQTVTTQNGLFSIMLGSVSSLDSVDFNQTLYLGIEVENDGEMSPRKILGSVTSAFEADKLDGISSDQFFRNDIVNATNTATTSMVIQQSGSGDIARFIGASGANALTITSAGRVAIGTTTPDYTFQIHADSGQSDFAVTTNTNVGSANVTSLQFISDYDGTQNPAMLGQFNDGSLRLSGGGNLVSPDMVITDAGNVGIGTASPSEKLSVSGNANVTGNVTASSFTASSTTATSTFPNIDTTNIDISGRLYDSSASSGTSGYVLQTTGTGISWVATTSLGFVDTGITSYGIGDDVTSGTSGSVLFVDSSGNLAQDNAGFFWDATNDRLGIGTTSPSTAFSVGNTNGLNITDDGRIFAYTPSNIYTPSFKIEDTRGDIFSYIGAQNYVELNVKTALVDTGASWVGNFAKGSGPGTLALNFNAGATTVGSIGIDSSNNFSMLGGNSLDFNFGVGNSSNFNITTGASSNINAVAGNTGGTGNLSMLGTTGGSGNTAGIVTSGGEEVSFKTASTTRLTIDSTGNVGIGTTTPDKDLVVDGDALITGALYDGSTSAGTNGYVLQTTGTGINWVATSSLGFVDTGITSYGIGDDVTSGTSGSVLFVDSSGNLAQDNTNFNYNIGTGYLVISNSSNSSIVGNNNTFSSMPTNSSIFGLANTIDTGNDLLVVVGNLNDVSAGNYSTVVGSDNTIYSTDAQQTVIGYYNIVGGTSATALGFYNNASNSDTTSIGQYNTVSGQGSVGVGYTNTASGAYSTALGYINTASASYSTAVGFRTRATAIGASVFGGGANGASASMTNNTANSTLIGPNATSSIHILSTGEVKLPYLTSTSTTATSTLPNLTSTNVVATNLSTTNSTTTNSTITGRLYDGSSSAGTSGYILQTTGTGIEWVATSSLGISSSPAGSDTQVQFNDGGSFGGDTDFTYDKTTNSLSVSGSVITNSIGSSGDVDYGYNISQTSVSVYDTTSSYTSSLNAGSAYVYDGFDFTYLTSNYLNFSNTTGSSGFGLRNNSGNIEFKNSTGDWTSFDFLEPSQPIFSIGSVSAYSGSSLPSGWLWADGSAISRTTYADLFALIGTTYGVGDGSTTFNLPDLRGRTIAGKDNMNNSEGTGGGDAGRLTSGSKAAVDGDTLGASGGVQEHLLTWQESGLKPHSHLYADYYHASAVTRASGGASTASSGYGAANRTSYDNTAEDADEAHTNVQPTLVLNYIIRYTHAEANAAFWSLNGSDLYNATGSVGIGTSTPQRALHVAISTDGAPVRFQDSNGYCEINPTSTTWTCTSDERLKENIISVASSTPDLAERMMKLRPVTFEWKTDETNSERVGFIAQEVEVLFPDFVTTDSETGLKSVSYGSFVPYIISVLQDLSKQIQVLTQRLDEITSNSFKTVAGVITKLTIGSSEKPTGITLFDEATGDPYCLSVKNGDVITKIGECIVDEQDNSSGNLSIEEEIAPEAVNGNSVESGNEPESEPVVIQENQTSGGDPDFTSNIEETVDQDIIFENTDSDNTGTSTELVEDELVDQSIQEGDEVVDVETNQSSGSVELPIE